MTAVSYSVSELWAQLRMYSCAEQCSMLLPHGKLCWLQADCKQQALSHEFKSILCLGCSYCFSGMCPSTIVPSVYCPLPLTFFFTAKTACLGNGVHYRTFVAVFQVISVVDGVDQVYRLVCLRYPCVLLVAQREGSAYLKAALKLRSS